MQPEPEIAENGRMSEKHEPYIEYMNMRPRPIH